MCKGSPFYIENHLGKLELTKGAYLTLQKRKASTLRTLTKTRFITKETPKHTRKRIYHHATAHFSSLPTVEMLNRRGEEVSFLVSK